MNAAGHNENIYRIGAISNLTGLSTHTIRAWERRYGMDLSQRTEGGTRLYSEATLERLTLLKKLIDNGESISVLASLNLEELRNRLEQFSASPAASAHRQSSMKSKLKIAMLSKLPGVQPHYKTTRGDVVEVVFNTTDKTVFSQYLENNVDVLDAVVVQLDIIPSKSPNLLDDWISAYPMTNFVVVYELGSKRELLALLERGVKSLRGPIPDPVLFDLIGESFHSSPNTNVDPQTEPFASEAIFSNEQLSKLANLPTSIQCECPSHMSSIIHSLNAFEAYCKHCESTSPEDAALHAELAVETAKARTIMERILLKVCVQDNINI